MKKNDSHKASLTPDYSKESTDFQNADLAAILNSSNARIWTIDKNYCLIYGNSKYLKECNIAFGREIKFGQSVLIEDLNNDERLELQNYYDRALKGEKFSVERKRKYSKETKWNIYQFGPLHDKTGKRIGASVVAQDITERVLANEALQNSTKHYEELLEMLPEAVFEMDVELRLTYVNQSGLDLLGYTSDEISSKALTGLDMLIPDQREFAKRNFIKRLKGENLGLIEYSGLKKDGSVFPMIFHANSVIEFGKLKGVRGVIVDISDLKNAERKLVEYKELFSLFMKHSPIYTFIKEVSPTESRVIQASDNYREMIGIPGSEMIGKTMEELFPAEFAAKMTADDWDVVSQGKILQEDEDLNERHYTTIKFPIEREGKKLLAGYTIDITIRKQAEEKQKQLAMMLDLAPSSIIIHDFDGNFLYVNQKTFEYHGYTREEFMSLSLKELSSTESFKSLPSRMKLLHEKGEANFEVVHIKKDGSELQQEVLALVTKWNGHQAILSVGTDITKRKQDEKTLQESEEKFKNIFNNSVVGISVTDLEGKLTVNKAFTQIVGYSEAELNNSKWEKITHPEDIDKNQKILKAILTGKSQNARWEKRYIHKNGSIVWADISTTLQRDNNRNPQYFITTIVDITEKKQAEEELIESEERYRNVIDISPDAIIIHCEGKIVLTNKAAVQLVGGTGPDDLLGKSALEFVHPDDREMVKIRIMDLIKSGEPAPLYEERMIRFDGSVIYTEVAAVRTTYKGKPASLVVLRDITERKQAEEKLVESEERFRSLYENSTMGLYRTTPDGKILMANLALAKMLLYDSSEELCKRKLDIEGFKQSSDRKEFIERIEKDGVVLGLESIWRRKDNTLIYVRESARAISDSNGKILYYDGTVENITERKEIELELIKAKEKAEETEVQLLSILENSPTGFAINSISTGKVSYLNKAFIEAYHIPLELCDSVESFFEYVYGEQMELGNKILEDVLSGDPERMKWDKVPVIDKTTKRTHFVSAANIILKDLDLMISSVSDITERVENEDNLIKARNKATESDRLKSAFLANMSHEIRTPMNGILGFANLLKEPQLSGEKQKKYIEIIEKSGERMLNTINDIIDISKIEAGQMEISLSEFDITELFENTLSFFKLYADKKGVKLLFFNNLTEKEVVIISDKEKINAVLINLVKNAIKFCDEGIIEIGCSRKNNFIELYVKDTGKGIPPDRLYAIFERFVQADIEDREVKEGSGLGLAISKSYVELLGGKIWVESELKKGSTFFFTIPLQQAIISQNNQLIYTNKSEDKMKKINILIAEDDQVSEMLTKILVGEISEKIYIAKTGIETVEICKNNADIDLILLDIKMPVMNGYIAAQAIREFNKEVIIIALTAFALTGDREKALEAGCNDYLTKPLSKDRFMKMLAFYFE